VTALRSALPERNLDTLRAFAVLCVLANHVIMVAPFGSAVMLGYWLGRAGVLAFFVHTSLVLMSSLERHGTEGQDVTAFYIRRAFRIYPLAIVAILLVVAMHMPSTVPVHGVVTPYIRPRLPRLLANLALVQNLTESRDVVLVLWTLPIELQMYAVLPLCYLAAKRGPAAVASLLAVSVAAANVWVANITPDLWRLDTLFFAPCFLSGVLAYALLRRQRRPARLPSWIWLALLPINLIVCSFFALQSDADVWESRRWMQWIFCLVLGLSIPLIRDMHPSLFSRGAKTIAKYSYGMYLFHVPALWIGFIVLGSAPALVRWMASAALAVAMPLVGYHVVEEPGILLGARVAARWVRLIKVRLAEPVQPVAP
jgi:peptidoglycan/LPS O-acetylase OafA/YrhL